MNPVAAPAHPIAKPGAGEHVPYYSKYIDLVPGGDAGAALASQIGETLALLRPLDEKRALHRYATGKWSVKEVLGHLMDGERVFSYRALRFARKDETPLPGFDEKLWAPAGNFDRLPFSDLLDDFAALRASTVRMFRSFEPDALTRMGKANGDPISVRALAWIAAGHELHHRNVLRERYLAG